MVSMRVVEVPVNQVIGMVAVRDGRMAAGWAMDVFRFMTGRTASALFRIGLSDFNDVFIHMIAVRMVKMPVVKIIHMITMFHGGVSTIWAMNVGVISVCGASG